jgi:Concanavalin A-like lectin/glucanases superfamily
MRTNSNHELRLLFVTLSFTMISTVIVLNFNIAFSQNEDVSFLDVNGTNSAQLSKFSVAAWFKTSHDYNSDAFIVNKAGSSDKMNYGIWMTNIETIRGGFESSSGSAFYATSPLPYNDGNWHYALVTFDGIALTLYIDGLPVAIKSASASPDSGGEEPIRMGADSQSLSNYFIGNVDEVRIWKNALTPQQVIEAYNGNFNPQDLIEYMDFSEPIVSVNATSPVNVTSTNQTGILDNNGTLNNGTLPVSDNSTSNTNDTGVIIPPVEIPPISNDTDSNIDVGNNNNDNNNTSQSEDNANTNTNTNMQVLEQPNQSPKADAGEDQKAEMNTQVKLDSADSNDQDGKIVSHKWEQTDGPQVELEDSDKQIAVFDVPESAADSNLVFKLTVTDDKGDTGEDEVTIEVEQIPQDESDS